MMNFEYLLRYYLKSSTLKLKDVKNLTNSNLEKEFFKRFNKNECIYGTFLKKTNNTIVPLLNLPIDFKETEHMIFYGVIAPGKTIFADKKYSLEFSPNDGFENYIIFDTDLKTIADFENDSHDREHIELSDISEAKNCESFEINKEFQAKCGIDKTKVNQKLKQILDEYKQLGYERVHDSSTFEPSSMTSHDEAYINKNRETFHFDSTEHHFVGEDPDSTERFFKQSRQQETNNKPVKNDTQKNNGTQNTQNNGTYNGVTYN
ncbi:putative E3 ubiquitin ligase, partial [Pseudoloma neurophilia]